MLPNLLFDLPRVLQDVGNVDIVVVGIVLFRLASVFGSVLVLLFAFWGVGNRLRTFARGYEGIF